jgi:CRISPR-associated protein Csb2
MGFDPRAREALTRVRTAYAAKIPRMFLTLVGLGERPDFESLVPCVREALVWRSVSPFVPPRHLKPRGPSSLEGQVQAELASRRLPAAARVEMELDGGHYLPAADFWPLWERRAPAVAVAPPDAPQPSTPSGSLPDARLAPYWRHFRRQRLAKGSPKPPVATGFGLRITFAEPVRGPIALGYASHFGLGTMTPEGEE